AIGSTVNVAATSVPSEVAKQKLTVASAAIEVEVKDKDGKKVSEVKTPMTIAIPYSSGATLALAGIDAKTENLCAILKSASSMYVWRYSDLIVDKAKNLVNLKSKVLGVFTLAYCGQQKLDGMKEAASTGTTGTTTTTTTTTTTATKETVSTNSGTTTTNPPYITSITPSVAGLYGLDDTIAVEASFNEAVVVSGGVPYLEMYADNLLKRLNYVSGSGTSKLMFRSEVISKGWNDLDGTHLTGALMETRYVKSTKGLTAVSGFNPGAYAGLKVSTPWMTQMGATTKQLNLTDANIGSDNCEAVTTDVYGNVYCTGSTTGNIGSGSAGGLDLYIAKFNMHGQLNWVYQHGNHLQQVCKALTSDSDGNIYCAGNTEGNIDGGTGNSSGYDGFILKLNANGGVEWIKQYGTNAIIDECLGVAVDATHVYCGGVTGGTPMIKKVLKSNGAEVWSKIFTNVDGKCAII
ncbi:SBBP repeat-containing protein, partial [Dolichospermum sp. ST_sed1]|nr:SBBP repeat-containing protein [Dolichospermum sp. ST_sed1]